MESIKLWGVVLPRMTNMLGKSAQTLRIDGKDKPVVTRLEWSPEEGMVLVELESKPEMPTVILIPREQVSAMVPMPKKATTAKLPDETVSSSKSEVLKREITLDKLPGKPKAAIEYSTTYEPPEPYAGTPTQLKAALKRGQDLLAKPKPKKRGRPKKVKN